jgi:transcriptional regulator with PAS, ATPase and Fis domain
LFPELGSVPSWTSSVKGEEVVVRGGETCASEGRAAPIERALSRFGMCCDRAIAMTTANLQKPYLVTTAERVLSLERALNQRNVQALLDLSEPTIVIDEQQKTAAELKKSIEADFRSAPELVVLNDSCDVSVQAKKVTKLQKRKKKKIVYQTQGWTADCRQTAILPNSVNSHDVSYNFSATSKLREISTQNEE